MEIIRKHYHITGRVQGVGFRYRAKYAAQSLGVSGWVANEPDGSVTMELQGREDQINLVMKEINMGSFIVMDWIDSSEIPVREEHGFRVRY